MESILQKWGWIGHLLMIALVAVLMASAVNHTIAVYLAPYTVPEVPELARASTPSKKPARAPRARSLTRPIVERCLFGCPEEAPPPEECPDGCAEGEVCQAGECVPGSEEEVPSELPIASDLNVKLMGAMVADDPEFSIALFSDTSAKATYILGIGDQLLGQAEIIDIRRDRVIVRRNNRLEFVQLEASLLGAPTLTNTVARPVPKPTPAVTSRPTPAAKGDEAGDEEPKSRAAAQRARTGVQKVGDGEFELDRNVMQQKLDDPEAMARGAKVIPNYENGQKKGIKLVGVRGDSVYSQLGIESGDVVTAINGTKIKNQAHALELLQSLRSAKEASIEVERRGSTTQLKYRVK